MTREEAKELLSIIQAFAEGKTIQVRINNNDTWTDLLDNKLEISKLFEYRIKPEPKYRPFKNKEECWNEMLKHQPFGYIVNEHNNVAHINGLSLDINGDLRIHLSYCFGVINAEDAYNLYKFADGTPFGMKGE